tara:strand:+ start:1278 stop:1769 length:492 start_codon:yes stop_codon:yes gene_type:complete
MTTYKLLMDDDVKETFSLLAIHCSEDAYILAYLLNKHLGFHLKRERLDLNYVSNGLEASFPLFQYENNFQYTIYNLVANKCKSLAAHVNSSGGLFYDDASEKTVVTYLIPEYRKVDYFLKIHSEYERIVLKNIITEINNIKRIISAYEIGVDSLKSKNNLIFN